MAEKTLSIRDTLGAAGFAVVAAFGAFMALLHGYLGFWVVADVVVMFLIGAAALRGCRNGSRESNGQGAMTGIVGIIGYRGFESVMFYHSFHPILLIYWIFTGIFAYAVGAAVAITLGK
jgi:hypothetical protein